MDDLISRVDALEALNGINGTAELDKAFEAIEALPSAQPELIEKAAYIRGFEQGRTHVMIDSPRLEEMNKQRKFLITITYNEIGLIIDAKAEEVAQPNLQPTCN